ncbi:ABC transporter permease [Natrinema gelatinilyticum]|uniref:ABC transporter permease n=1 Tax=Natrinema gelatinilyticum TaxID=2961571 RepID=UPI0020C516CF|nr:ABC transporter permease subunit [Natrinema gelatinilyticum]
MNVEPQTIAAVARKEFTDHVRNRWVGALTVIFLVLTMAAALLTGGAAFDASVFGDFQSTVATLTGITSILIPLIGILLGYATISGEVESGTLSLELAYPVSRTEILLGKVIGLGTVLVVSALIGFGFSGLVIAVADGAGNATAYVDFVGLSLLIGILYLSLAVSISTIFERRATSIAACIVLFFWSMVHGIVIFSLYFVTGGSLNSLLLGELPDWIWASIVLSPFDMYQLAVMKSVGNFLITPGYMSIEFLIGVQSGWIVVALGIAFYSFQRRDM